MQEQSPLDPQWRHRYTGPMLTLDTGDILLCRGSSLSSYFIRALSFSTYSHSAFIGFVDGELWWFESTTDAKPQGVQVVPFQSRLNEYVGSVDLYKLHPAARAMLDPDKLVYVGLALRGKGFAYSGSADAGAASLLTDRSDHPARIMPDRSLFCSEYVSKCMRFAGVDLVPGIPDHMTTPKDFARSRMLVKTATLR